MRFVLYNHIGSANHGCEALVRTISKMLGEDKTILLSDFPNEEETYGVKENIQVIPAVMSKKKFNLEFLYAYMMLKLKRNYFYMDILPYKPAIKNLEYQDVLVSIGGDIFCYDNYPKYNLLHQYALKKNEHSILVGCSIEPELLDDSLLLNDLKSFEVISAREHITYDALKGKGLDNILYCPDSAFCLEMKKSKLPENFLPGNTVGINISPLVLNKSTDAELILDNLRQVVKDVLKNTDASVAFIPHVVWENNDDRVPLRQLYKEFSDTNRVCMVEDQEAGKLKWIISQCSFFIGARTHATIAAYSTGVPTLVLGYSVKSRGIAKDLFGTEENYVISYKDITSENQVLEKFYWIVEHSDTIVSTLKEKVKLYQKEIVNFGEKIKKKYEEKI